jgi:prepilin-type N-terminal cleavage/methylation domain-containing protein
MSKQKFRTLKIGRKSGFTITEAIITSAIIGTLTSIAYPSYTNANNSSKLANAEARIQSIPPIIGAFIDATGEAPSTWEDPSLDRAYRCCGSAGLRHHPHGASSC